MNEAHIIPKFSAGMFCIETFVLEKTLAWQLWEMDREIAQSSTSPFPNACLEFGDGAVCNFHAQKLFLCSTVALSGSMFKTALLDSVSLLSAPLVAS